MKEMISYFRSEKGSTGAGFLFALVLMPIFAFLFMYIGYALGWLFGQIADFLPLVRDVAPMLSKKFNLLGQQLPRHELNVIYYTMTGTIGGFWAGLWAPLTSWAKN